MIVEVRSIPMTETEQVTRPKGDPCPVCHRACSQQVYIAGVGWRYIALPYPATWHAAAYDDAQAACIAARRAGASTAEARAAGEAAYRRAWQTCRLAPAA